MTVLEKIKAFFKRQRKTVEAGQPESAAEGAEKKASETPEKNTG